MVASHKYESTVQYLTWALEKIDHPKATNYIRLALDELRRDTADEPIRYAEEAKRFRDKADEAEQLAELAKTSSRRSTLMAVAETYRRTAAQLEGLLQGVGA